MTHPDITADKLRSIRHDSLINFKLFIQHKTLGQSLFVCTQIVRCLPESRISCIGLWQDKQVFVKIFISKKHAKTHYLREQKGIELLNDKHIIAPHIIHLATALKMEVHIIVFDFIVPATNTQVAWDNATPITRPTLLKKLLTLIAEHHNKGIIQRDLHLGNFLLSGDTIVTLDGSDIHQTSINQQQAMAHLALFFAQFYPENDTHIKPCFLLYGVLRQWAIKRPLLDKLLKLTRLAREKRKINFLKKIYRECSLFAYQSQWQKRSICNRQYLTSEMTELIKSPDKFMANGVFLKKGYGVTVSAVSLNGQQLVVKRYNTKNSLHAIRQAFRQSRASKSWKNAHMLDFYDIPAIKPIALIENRWGFIRRKSYFITAFQAGELCSHFFLASQHNDHDKADAARRIVATLKNMHHLGVTHGDLKASNLLISALHPTLIDLDSTRQHRIPFLFNKAEKKDIDRFLKNWHNHKACSTLFRTLFHHN